MSAGKIKSRSEQRFTLEEVEQIAGNYAIHCLKGYNGSFQDWFQPRVRENVINNILDRQSKNEWK